VVVVEVSELEVVVSEVDGGAGLKLSLSISTSRFATVVFPVTTPSTS
jgi:hypothetical protein